MLPCRTGVWVAESFFDAKFALFGLPGSGKSTFRKVSELVARDLGFQLQHLRLADPLYAAQEAIYGIVGAPLDTPDTQDGELLNMLGVHMRRINPRVLEEHATARIRELTAAPTRHPGNGRVLICDDMRPIDAPFMKRLGFKFVFIDIPATVSVDRRESRGDISLGSLSDPNECGVAGIDHDFVIDNSGDVSDLFEAAKRFWEGAVFDTDRS
jgi:cytidine deaminase